MYTVILFLHVMAVAAAFFGGGFMVSSILRIRSAATAHDALQACILNDRIEKIMPLATLVLLATGAYMTHDRWTWTTPWILVGIAGLLVVTVFGAAVLGSRSRKLAAALRDGMAYDAMLFTGNGLNMGLVLGVMFIMTVKPDFVGSIASLVLGGSLGAGAFALLQGEKPVSATAKAEAAAQEL